MAVIRKTEKKSPETIIFYERFSLDPDRRERRFIQVNYSHIRSHLEQIESFRKESSGRISPNDLVYQPADHNDHYGGGVFEGIRAKPKGEFERGELIVDSPLELSIINGEKNAERFLRSMDSLGLRPPQTEPHDLPSEVLERLKLYDGSKDVFIPDSFTPKYILEVLCDVIRLNTDAGHINPEKGEIYLRPLAFRSSHPEGRLGVYSLQHDIVFIAMVQEWGDYLPNGLKLVVPRDGVESPIRRTKASANYALGQKAKNDATRFVTPNGIYSFDDALFTDNGRNVEEATGANFFGMKGEQIVTPPLAQYILPGITRETAIRLARGIGFDVNDKEEIPLERLAEFDCFFLSGSATGLRSGALVYDPKTKSAYTFDQNHGPFLALQKEFNHLLYGMTVEPRNQDLQQQIRSALVPFGR